MLKGDTIFVSATPGDYEAKRDPALPMIEQVVRPTGLLDPLIEVRPLETQIDDVLSEGESDIYYLWLFSDNSGYKGHPTVAGCPL